MKKAIETEGVYAVKLSDALVTSSSEYGIKIWGFKGLEKLEKTNLHFYKYIFGVTHSTADSLVYEETGKVLCQFRFTCKLYYRFRSFLAPLSVGINTSRHYLSEHNKNGEQTNGTGDNKNGGDEKTAE